jgi:hypothetical protein
LHRPRRSLTNRDESILVVKWQTAKRHRVHDRKNRRRGADCHREHGDRSHADAPG